MKKGFTLAEVLITLGIIGIVAAMTIPTLINNNQKRVLSSQLKKEIATIENAFRKFIADETQAEVFTAGRFSGRNQIVINPDVFQRELQLEEITERDSKLTKFVYENEYCQNGKVFAFKDGAYIGFCEEDDYVYLDVNGASKPNAGCQDIFIFQVVSTDHAISGNTDNDILSPEGREAIKQAVREARATNNYDIERLASLYCLVIVKNDNWEIKELY